MEKKILDFDTKQFEIELAAMARMADAAQVFVQAWQAQPVLKTKEFTQADLDGIISNGVRHIRNVIASLIAERQEKQLPGLSMQMAATEIQLIDVDPGRIDRIAESIQSTHPADKHNLANYKMLAVAKGLIFVPDKTKELIREKLTIYDSNETLSEINELGQLCANSANMLLKIMQDKRAAQEKATGLKNFHPVELFASHKEGMLQQQKGAMYMDQGKVMFNLKHFL